MVFNIIGIITVLLSAICEFSLGPPFQHEYLMRNTVKLPDVWAHIYFAGGWGDVCPRWARLRLSYTQYFSYNYRLLLRISIFRVQIPSFRRPSVSELNLGGLNSIRVSWSISLCNHHRSKIVGHRLRSKFLVDSTVSNQYNIIFFEGEPKSTSTLFWRDNWLPACFYHGLLDSTGVSRMRAEIKASGPWINWSINW